MAKKLFFMGILVSLSGVGCSTTITTIPLFYANNQNTEFEILGTVELRSSKNIGYIDLFYEAKRLFPSTDFVIDIMVDQRIFTKNQHWIAWFFTQLFWVGKKQDTRYEYIMRGTAIRYENVTAIPKNNVRWEWDWVVCAECGNIVGSLSQCPACGSKRFEVRRINIK